MRSTTELFLFTLIQLLLVSSFIQTMGSGLGVYDPKTDPLYDLLTKVFNFSSTNATSSDYTFFGMKWSLVSGFLPIDWGGLGAWGDTLNLILKIIGAIFIGIPVLAGYIMELVTVACSAVFSVPFIGPIICLYWLATIVAFGFASLPTTAKS
jgi:hypothetical protein